jgi:hypothetical protein
VVVGGVNQRPGGRGLFPWTAFSYANGSVATLHKYDGILHHFLQLVQQENPELIAEDNDVQGNYSFF